MKTRIILTLFSLFFLFSYVVGNERESYIFSKIDYQQGLSNSAVICVFQDNTGLMWFGTYDGVNCYDGRNMETYRSDFSLNTTLNNNVIHGIQQADSNCLWISTHLGVSRFSLNSRQVVSNYEFPSDYFLHSNTKGNTWVVGNNWLRYYNTHYKCFLPILKLKYTVTDAETRSFVTDDGSLWVFPEKTGDLHRYILNAFDQDSVSTKLNDSFSHFHTKVIEQVSYQNGVLCFIDSDKDLYMYDVSRKSKIYIRNIASLLQRYGDIKGIVPFYDDIIIAFRTNGMIRLEASKKYEESIVNRNVRVFDIYKDPRQGILWVGADGQGAIAYFKKYSIATNLMLSQMSPNLSRQVRSIMTDKYGGLWFGTKGDGLIYIKGYSSGLNPGGAVIYSPADLQNANSYVKLNTEFQVYKLQQSRYMDGFWIGSGDSGLFYYTFSDKKLHSVEDTSENPVVQIHAIHEAKDTVLYLATSGTGFRKVVLNKDGGDIRIQSQRQYRFYYEQHEITMFFSMISEGDSILWLGSREKGLVRFDTRTEEYKVISLKELLHKSVDDILCIHRYHNGQMYIGTTSGLVCLTFEGARIRSSFIGREQGLLNDMIHGILEDANGFLWLGTNKGLIKYNPVNGSSHAYFYSGGVQIGEFSDDAYYKCPYTGRLFFGGIDGLLYMNKEVVSAPEFYPDILLRKLNIGRKEVNLNDYYADDRTALRLHGSDLSFSLTFAVPDYVTGADVEYSYMLEGHDKDWTPFSSINEASYTSVPAGDYVFKVRYKKDVFGTEYKYFSIPVYILPPWYQSTFAYIIYILFFLGIGLYVAYLLRKNILQEKRMKKLLNIEHKNSSLTVTEYQNRELTNSFTTIYHACDQLRSENITTEQRAREIELIRETVMSLLFGSNVIQSEDVKMISPINFTITGIINLREASDEILSLLKERNTDVSLIRNAMSEDFSFPVYKNALKCILYYCYLYIAHSKITSEVTVDAQSEGELMTLVFTSDSDILKNLQKTLSEKELVNVHLKQVDEIFHIQILQRFVQAALKQLDCGLQCDEFEEGHRLTITFSSASMAPERVEGEKKIVLLLEDKDEMVWLINGLLSEEFVIDRVKSAQQAFERLKENPPAVFLVDMLIYAEAEGTFMEYMSENRSLLAKTAFVPMLTWKVSSAIQQDLILGSDSYIVLPYDILFLKQVVLKAIYGKQVPKQVYVEGLGEFASQITCATVEQADFIKKMLQVVEKNLDREDMGSSFVANEMAMSPRQFYRKFKEISGMPPSDLIKNYRMEKAAHLLLNSEFSIQDVISEVGISSRSYFYKEFTRKYKMTPKDYRDLHRDLKEED